MLSSIVQYFEFKAEFRVSTPEYKQFSVVYDTRVLVECIYSIECSKRVGNELMVSLLGCSSIVQQSEFCAAVFRMSTPEYNQYSVVRILY